MWGEVKRKQGGGVRNPKDSLLTMKAHENTSAFIKSGSSQYVQNSFTFYNTGYKKIRFENTDREISEAQNQMKFSVLVKSICLVHKAISQQNQQC